MQQVLSFFFRLFLAFLAAKFLARFFGFQSLGALLVLTCLFLGNIYLFDLMDYRSSSSWRRRRNLRQEPPSAAPPPTEEIPPKS